ncbi:hypothetical protein MPER_07540, partial [Moniliophthora perniciosa FA553]
MLQATRINVSPLFYSDSLDSTESYPIFPNASAANLLTVQANRQKAVVDAFKHAWKAYERDAMGSDEYHPQSGRGTNFSGHGGIGYFIVDALDTMHLMGLRSEYERARQWVQDELSFKRNGMYSTFETTIRVLGGLLSAYFLTSDPLYRERAIELGERILPAFNTPSGLPISIINLATVEDMQGGIRGMGMAYGNIAEVASLQLEFKYLAEIAKNETFWRKAENVMAVVNRALPENGLAQFES